MKTLFLHPLASIVLMLGLFATPSSRAEVHLPDTDEQVVADITALVNYFLKNVDQAATHDRFWAADLVYTSSSGSVTNKAEIMKGFEPAPDVATDTAGTAAAAPAQDAPRDTYTAEDILVRPHGDAAALTFRLVLHGADGKKTFYRNSGMLLKRNGQWQVITWQATKVPEEAAAK